MYDIGLVKKPPHLISEMSKILALHYDNWI